MKGRRTILFGGLVVLAAGALAMGGFWPQQRPEAAAPAPALATAAIARGPLRDTKTVTGTLGYGDLSAIRPRLAASSAMVTWMAPEGAVVRRGEPVYALDGQPAVLFYGATPQHRTLRFDPGAAAPVWVEREEAETAVKTAELTLTLEKARLAEAEAREADAEARLEDALLPEQATAELVRLVGAVRVAEARLSRVRELSAAEITPEAEVATAEAELANARAALEAAIRAIRKELAGARLDAANARVAVASAETRLAELETELATLVARAADSADIAQLTDNLDALGFTGSPDEQVRAWQTAAGLPVTGIVRPEHLVIAGGPVHIAEHSASVGETLVAASAERGAILDYSATEKLVVVPLAVGDQALAAVGRAVTVTLPDDSAVAGTIAKVGSVVSNGTFEVTIAIAEQARLGELEVASVDVEFTSDSRSDVLFVPIAALLARDGGGYALGVVEPAGSRLVPVETGLFADGRVEVSGEGLAEGMRVSVPG